MLRENSFQTDTEPLCCVQDFEKQALKILPRDVLGYYRSGACDQLTLHNNQESFKRLRIRPRCLVDVSDQDTSMEIFGEKIKVPFGISPTAMQKMAHPDGEVGNARAAGAVGTIYILSTLSTTSLEEVAKEAPNTIKWFQLYVYKNKNITVDIIRRVEKAGYRALVLTVDANVFGIRYADTKNSFHMPLNLSFGNFIKYSEMTKMSDKEVGSSGLNRYTDALFDDKISWKDVKWLKSVTSLPIILKGILTAEDALKALEYNVAGIMVSNHGGRQLDTVPSSIEALPEIVEAVGGKIEILFDGGVRYGTDIFKALALGAKMVFIGRPALWGLTCGGEKGVKEILDILSREFNNTLALAGCNRIADIKKEMVVHESFYHKL